MSRPVIAYPTDWVLAVIDRPDQAEEAAREVRAAGVAPEDVIVLAGEEAADRMTRLGTSAGIAANIRRTMQFMTMDQMPDLHVYELALARGHAVVGVRIADDARRREALDVLRGNGAHFINRFGSWATEEIAPWRGDMPELPQHMRR